MRTEQTDDPFAMNWVERLAQVVLVTLFVGVLFWLFSKVGPVLAPVAVSLLLAYLLDPVVDIFERRRINRSLAIMFLAAMVFGTIGVIGFLVLPSIAEEIGRAVAMLPEWVDETWEKWRVIIVERFGTDPEPRISAFLRSLGARLQTMAGSIANSTLSSLSSLLNLILIPIFTFYFLRDFDALKKKPLALIPPRFRSGVVDRAGRMDQVVGAWVRGQVQVALTLAVLYATGLGVVGVKMGVFIGLMAGLLNVVPYLGAVSGFVLSMLMALIYGGDATMTQLIGVLVVFAIVQGLEGYVITPRLVGKQVGMGPTTVMIVLLLGGSLFGFFGLMLSIPLVAAGSVVANDLIRWYETTPWFLKQRDAGSEKAADSSTAQTSPSGAVNEEDTAGEAAAADHGSGEGVVIGSDVERSPAPNGATPDDPA